MKRARTVVVCAASLGLLLAQACSGDDSNQADAGPDSAADATPDVSRQDGSNDAAEDVAPSDGGCPSSWTATPTASPALVPDGGGVVQVHGAASGTQDYTCEATTDDAGATTYAWTFIGPEATLVDCAQNVIAHHFANDAGAAEWQATDQSYVVAKKVAAFTPDGGAGSIPWLLLQAVSTSGTGTLGATTYVQRLATDGGAAPSATCDSQSVGVTSKTPYAADYYFYGN